LERLYTGVWHGGLARDWEEAHGLAPAEHLAWCRRLAAEGYRPAALSLAEVAPVAGRVPVRRLVAASVSHRPARAATEPVALARRGATVAAALLSLAREAPAAEAPGWSLLRHTPPPDARSYLLAGLGALGVAPATLARRLKVEEDTSARRALILALGEYDA